MDCLVTGGTGFIGQHLVRRLSSEGWRVHVLTRSPGKASNLPVSSWVTGDLDDMCALDAAVSHVSIVFHLASVVPGISDAKQMLNTNTTGTQHLVEACLRSNVRRLVYISSVSVYRAPLADIIAEDAALGGVELYGQSKHRAENVIRELAGDSLDYVILRLSQVYGAGDRSGFTQSLLQLCELPLLPICRGDDRALSLLHVDDAIEAIVAAGNVENTNSKVFNVSCEKRLSLNDLASYYTNKTGKWQYRVPIPAILFRVALQLRWFLKSLQNTGVRPRIRSYRITELHGSVWMGGPEYNTNSARRYLGYQSKIPPEQGVYQLRNYLELKHG